RDVETAGARRLDLRDDVSDLPEVVLAAHLDVIDVHRDAGRLGNVDRLVELLVDLAAFATDVGAVVATVARDDLRHRHHLVFVLVAAAGECGRQVDGALLHRLRNQLLHLLDLRRRRAPVLEADDHAPYLLRRDARGDVDRRTFLIETPEVAIESGPVDIDAAPPLGLLLVFLEHAALERRHRHALADHVERHALAYFAFAIAVGNDRVVGMGVEVDEARRDDHALGVDHALAELGIDPPDLGD